MRTVGVLVIVGALVSGCTRSAPGEQTDLSSIAAPSAVTVSVPLNFRTHLNGEAERPVPRDTHAQGQAIFQLDKEGASISYRLIAANIENVFQAHIHLGGVDATGPIVVWLYPSTDPVAGPLGAGRHNGVLATGTITAANLVNVLAGRPLSELMDAITSGNTYVNVHTNDGIPPTNTGSGDFPGGEIRGQL
jgi:CHRD domain